MALSRSRRPERSVPQVAISRLMSSVASAADRRGGSPCVRAMPRRVSRIAGCRVSSGCLAIRCARDGGYATPQRRQRVAQAGGSEIGADGLRLGRQSLEAVRRAPGAKIIEVGFVGAQGLRRVGGRLVGFGLGECQGGARGRGLVACGEAGPLP